MPRDIHRDKNYFDKQIDLYSQFIQEELYKLLSHDQEVIRAAERSISAYTRLTAQAMYSRGTRHIWLNKSL